MCGIAGIVSSYTAANPDTILNMTRCLRHRGPDNEAIWQSQSGTVWLAHNRLTIIDPSEEANQPMHYRQRYTIVFNGEIYNYIELREILAGRGYRFATQSDTEVLLAGYAHWGEACLNHLDGMFAFAIWDDQEQLLFAARDRFGEKPFYFCLTDETRTLLFTSEIKGLLAAGVSGQYNANAILQYLGSGLTFNATQPTHTFYRDIAKLPPAHYLIYRPQQHQTLISRYYDIETTIPAKDTEEEAISALQNLLSTSVSRRLRSDVPVGTSLSGGLDSATIAAFIHQQKNKDAVQYAFTAVFPGFERDEERYAKLVAARFGLQHILVKPDEDSLTADMERFFDVHDEPVASASAYAQYKVYEAARQQGVKVVLDGQGADELFAGYSKYLHWALQELWLADKKSFAAELKALQENGYKIKWKGRNGLAAWLPAIAAGQLEKKAAGQQRRHPYLSPSFIRTAFDAKAIYKPIVRSLNDILYFDTAFGGLQELLRYADANSMAHGVEVRLPFLFHELVQKAFSWPVLFKINGGYTKSILRRAAAPYLPHDIVWRKDKVGFEPPQQQWMGSPAVQKAVRIAKQKLVDAHIAKPSLLSTTAQPSAAHAADNYDWRYLSVAAIL